jgi:hypothetical protein
VRREAVSVKGNYPNADEQSGARVIGVVVPAPAMLGFFAAVVAPRESISGSHAASYSEALTHCLTVFAVPLILVSLLSAALAFLCWRHHRRYDQPGSGAWFVFVLLTGIPGLVGYFYHRRWPVREACPACGKLVTRDRDACAACGKEFPRPQPKGIEVFA